MRRDKVDTKQYYKAELDSWAWKGKQWGIPFATGGETVLYNKKLFDAKGVKYPHKDWTYDEFLDACRRLNDPANGKWAVQVGQNGIHYMMGTFMLNFGGKRLNEAKDRALYGDDPKSIQGAELNVDLHRRYGFTPTPEALATVPTGKFPMELEMVAMEINGVFRHAKARAAIGAQNLDFAPPPKGPGGPDGQRRRQRLVDHPALQEQGRRPGRPCAGSTPGRGCWPPRSRPWPGRP